MTDERQHCQGDAYCRAPLANAYGYCLRHWQMNTQVPAGTRPHRATTAELRDFRHQLKAGWSTPTAGMQLAGAKRGSYSPMMFAPWHLDGSDGEPWLYLSRWRVMTGQDAYRAYRRGIDTSDHEAGDHPDHEGRGCHLCAAEYHAEPAR